MVSTEGYQLCLLVQLIAKTRKAAGLVVPRTPEDAVRMLRGCHPEQDTLEVGPPGDESAYEDYLNVTVDSDSEWSQDEAFGKGLMDVPQADDAEAIELQMSAEDEDIRTGELREPQEHPSASDIETSPTIACAAVKI